MRFVVKSNNLCNTLRESTISLNRFTKMILFLNWFSIHRQIPLPLSSVKLFTKLLQLHGAARSPWIPHKKTCFSLLLLRVFLTVSPSSSAVPTWVWYNHLLPFGLCQRYAAKVISDQNIPIWNSNNAELCAFVYKQTYQTSPNAVQRINSQPHSCYDLTFNFSNVFLCVRCVSLILERNTVHYWS